MRRLLFLIPVAVSLLAASGPVQAQSDGTNRLSLEALTAPQPGDGQGGGHHRSHSYRPASHVHGYTHHYSYGHRRPSHHSHYSRWHRYHPSNSHYR